MKVPDGLVGIERDRKRGACNGNNSQEQNAKTERKNYIGL